MSEVSGERILTETTGLLVKSGQAIPHVFRVVSHSRDPKRFALFVYEKSLVSSLRDKFSVLSKAASKATAKALASVQASPEEATEEASAEELRIPTLCVPLTGAVQVTPGRAGMWSLRYKALGNRKSTEWHISGCAKADFVDKLLLAQEITKSTGSHFRVHGSSDFDWLWKFRPVVPDFSTATAAATAGGGEGESDSVSAFRSFQLLVLTWNVAGRAPPGGADPLQTAEAAEAGAAEAEKLVEELEGVLVRSPGIELFAICLQETCALNAQNALVLGNENGILWSEFFGGLLQGRFEVLFAESLVGITLIILGRANTGESSELRVGEITSSKVKTGFSGLVGNKGAVSVRLEIEGRMSLVVSNVHFSSGDGMEETRKKELDRLVTATEFSGASEGGLLENDAVFVAGDLNSRTTAEEGDELKGWMENGASKTFLFKEASFDFPPTYKLVIGKQGVFDQHRRPGWCDRVIYRDNEGAKVNIVKYESLPKVTYSDHTPVYALAEIDIMHQKDFFEKRRSGDV